MKPSAKELIIEQKRKSLVKTTEEFKKYICIKNCSRLGYMATMHMVADSLLTLHRFIKRVKKATKQIR